MCQCGDIDDLLNSGGDCAANVTPGVEPSFFFNCKDEVVSIPDPDPLLDCQISGDIILQAGSTWKKWDRVATSATIKDTHPYKGLWVTTLTVTIKGRTHDALCASNDLTNNEVVIINTDKIGQTFLYGDTKVGVTFSVTNSTTGAAGSDEESRIELEGTVSSTHPPYGYYGIY